ncbi:MAG: LysR family transcriptional regulator [Pseudomonadota bacterium]
MNTLNYHHLRYFREVALQGNLSRTAKRLRISQSALSIQIRTLEESLGHALFERVGRTLVLTEVGTITLDHANRIFGAGEELLNTLQRNGSSLPPLRVGALSTLSRNFQMSFLRPAIEGQKVELILKSGNTGTLLKALQSLELDVVLTTEVPQRDDGAEFAAQRISEQPVGLHGMMQFLDRPTLKDLLENEPLIVPTESAIRTGFESLVARLEITPRVLASVDDMAMVRLLARTGAGLAVAPAVALADEIASGHLSTAPFDLNISEPFYAVTIPRKFPHPSLADLLAG